MNEESDKAARGAAGEEKTEGTVKGTAGGEGALPPLDFSTFILSLSSSVLMNLGIVENPVTGKKEKETAMARQTIDLLMLLKEKTRGNLTEQETRLMEDVLNELQLWYVKVAG